MDGDAVTRPQWTTFKLHKPSALLGVATFVVVLVLGARLTLALTPDSLKPLVSSLAGIIVDEACSSKVSDARTECARTNQQELNAIRLEFSTAMDDLRRELEAQEKRQNRLCQRLASAETVLCVTQNVTDAYACRNQPRDGDCE